MVQLSSLIYYESQGSPPPAGDDLGIDITDCVFLFSPYQGFPDASVDPLRLADGTDLSFVNGVADSTAPQDASVEIYRNQIPGQPNLTTAVGVDNTESQLYRRGLSPFGPDQNGIFCDFRRGFASSQSFGFNSFGWTFITVAVANGANQNNTLANLGSSTNNNNSMRIRLRNNQLRVQAGGNSDYLTYNADFTEVSVLTIVSSANGGEASETIVLQNQNILLLDSQTGNDDVIFTVDNGMILHNRQNSNVQGALINGGTLFNAFFNNTDEDQRNFNIAQLEAFFLS